MATRSILASRTLATSSEPGSDIALVSLPDVRPPGYSHSARAGSVSSVTRKGPPTGASDGLVGYRRDWGSARLRRPRTPRVIAPDGVRAMAETAELRVGDRVVKLPIIEGSEGERAIDIRKLRDETGLITLDPGYANTGSCRSAITFIDGEKGILRYRGIPIEELAEHSNFLEVAYLLIYGELPTREEITSFVGSIRTTRCCTRTSGASSASCRRTRTRWPRARRWSARSPPSTRIRSIRATRATSRSRCTGCSRRCRRSRPTPTSTRSASRSSTRATSCAYVANFLHMMFATPCETYRRRIPVVDKALDLLLILHADHEQNCSTSTVRMVGSSMANLFAAISAGICALWGPLPRRRQPAGDRDARARSATRASRRASSSSAPRRAAPTARA